MKHYVNIVREGEIVSFLILDFPTESHFKAFCHDLIMDHARQGTKIAIVLLSYKEGRQGEFQIVNDAWPLWEDAVKEGKIEPYGRIFPS